MSEFSTLSALDEIEELKAENAMLKAEWHAEIERSKLYAKAQDLVVELRNAQLKQLEQFTQELVDEINNYLNNDGSRGHFWVVALNDSRKALEALLKRTLGES